MPKMVLAATAHSATTTVTRSACNADGVVSASRNGPKPSPNVRQTISPTGITSRKSR
jgi:hypothetical protein